MSKRKTRKRNYKPSRDIPDAIRELKSDNPTEIRNWVLKEFNKGRTPESISNWMRRNKAKVDPIRAELAGEALAEEELTEAAFNTGAFEDFRMVKIWDLSMRRGDIQNRTGNIAALKRVCQGIKPKINPLTQKQFKKGVKKATGAKGLDLKEHGWVLTHPHRIADYHPEVFNEWQDLMIEFYPKVDTSRERLVVRNFLVANHVPVTKGEISGRKHASAGTLSRLFVERPILDQIFDYLKKTDFQAYVVDKFMFKTGTRISATLAARLERIRVVDGVYDIQIFDKGVRSIHPEGKEWIKHISRDLLEDIKALTDYPDNKSGPIFTYEDQEMSDKNREALEKFYPQLWEQYPDYDDHNHFWRHMFAQHLLRKTGWNYGVVAALGGWDIKSLEESYGRPPVELMRKWGVELIADL